MLLCIATSVLRLLLVPCRSYIEAHIAKSGHDPARDLSLDAKQLYPNIVLRDQIATWLQKHGVET